MTSFLRPFVRFARGACLAVIATAAIASGPFISGPSMLESSDSAVFKGGGFAPNATVQVQIVDPSGARTVADAAVGSDGTVSFTVSGRSAGVHTVQVVDLSGAVLATASFMCPR